MEWTYFKFKFFKTRSVLSLRRPIVLLTTYDIAAGPNHHKNATYGIAMVTWPDIPDAKILAVHQFDALCHHFNKAFMYVCMYIVQFLHKTCRCLRALRVPPNTKNFPVDLVDVVESGEETLSPAVDPMFVAWSTSLYHVSADECDRLWLEALARRPTGCTDWFNAPSMWDRLAVDPFRTHGSSRKPAGTAVTNKQKIYNIFGTDDDDDDNSNNNQNNNNNSSQ